MEENPAFIKQPQSYSYLAMKKRYGQLFNRLHTHKRLLSPLQREQNVNLIPDFSCEISLLKARHVVIQFSRELKREFIYPRRACGDRDEEYSIFPFPVYLPRKLLLSKFYFIGLLNHTKSSVHSYRWPIDTNTMGRPSHGMKKHNPYTIRSSQYSASVWHDTAIVPCLSLDLQCRTGTTRLGTTRLYF